MRFLLKWFYSTSYCPVCCCFYRTVIISSLVYHNIHQSTERIYVTTDRMVGWFLILDNIKRQDVLLCILLRWIAGDSCFMTDHFHGYFFFKFTSWAMSCLPSYYSCVSSGRNTNYSRGLGFLMILIDFLNCKCEIQMLLVSMQFFYASSLYGKTFWAWSEQYIFLFTVYEKYFR